MRDAVLVVDDDPFVRRAFDRALNKTVDVETVACGHDGVRAVEARRGRYVLAMVDYGLPDIDGGEVARRIRAIDESVMLVVITGGPEPHAASTDAMRVTGARFALKPIAKAELLRLVAEARASTPAARIDAAVTEAAEDARLTAAEEHLVRIAAHGVPRSELAVRLAVTEYTVKMHVRSIVAKWNDAFLPQKWGGG